MPNENNEFTCGRCGDNHPIEQRNTTDEWGDVCNSCYEILLDEMEIVDDEGEERDVRHTDKYQSDEQGEIIKSSRKFGVELEVNIGRGAQEELRDMIASEFGLVHDGSVNNGIEVVSPILKGKAGEEKVMETCACLDKVGAGADESCGFHVHLDAIDFFANNDVFVSTLAQAIDMAEGDKHKGYEFIILHANTLKEIRSIGDGSLHSAIVDKMRLDTFYYDEFSSVVSDYFRQLPVSFSGSGEVNNRNKFSIVVTVGSRGVKLPTIYPTDDKSLANYRGEPSALTPWGGCLVDPITSSELLVICVPSGYAEKTFYSLKRLKRVASFYVAFDDVIASMLPLDRRENDFAKRLDVHMAIADIDRVNSLSEFFLLWTKEKDFTNFKRNARAGRHDSRYHGVNFHALLKHGTIEIRYHAGTIDANKALHWVALHQRILDIASDIDNNKMSIKRLEKSSMVIDTAMKADLFFSKLGLEKPTEDYLRKRMDEFQDEDSGFVASLLADDMND